MFGFFSFTVMQCSNAPPEIKILKSIFSEPRNYWYIAEQKSFQDANNFCNLHYNGYLATMESPKRSTECIQQISNQ